MPGQTPKLQRNPVSRGKKKGYKDETRKEEIPASEAGKEPKQTQPGGGCQGVAVQGAAVFNLRSFILKINRSSGWLHGFGRHECNFLPLERASELSTYV